MSGWISKLQNTPGIMIGLIFFIVSLPLALQKIKMNHVWGIRFPKSFSSEENWYKINKFGGILLLISAAIFFIIGLLQCFNVIPNNQQSEKILQVVYAFLIIVPLILSYLYTRYF